MFTKKDFQKEQPGPESKLDIMEANLLFSDPKQKEESFEYNKSYSKRFQKLIEIKAEGAATRSRACWMDSGEKILRIISIWKSGMQKNQSNPYAVLKVD